jgi:hypothetical protein
MVVKVSLLSGAVASDGVLSIQSNGTTEAISISTGQVATFVNNPILTGGTINGVAYLNGSKILTTGSALVFDETNTRLGIGISPTNRLHVAGTAAVIKVEGTSTSSPDYINFYNVSDKGYVGLETSTGTGIIGTGSAYALVVSSASTNPLVFGTNGTEKMRLDSAGNLGLGVTPSAWYSGYKALQVGSNNPAGFWSGGYDAQLSANLYEDASGTYKQIGASYRGALYTMFDSAHRWFTTTNVGANTSVTPSTAMTLDASGRLLVGGTSPVGSTFSTFEYSGTYNGLGLNVSTNTSGARFMLFASQGTQCGIIDRVGTTSAVVFTQTSDYRLKTVTNTVTGQGSRIDALKPIDYLWTEGGQQARGFLAHEFQEIYPNSVIGTKDAVDDDGKPVYQAMQASTPEVIADLVAEIQSLRQRLAALEAK